MIAVEFVCLGNICRSPLAEGVFRHLVTQAGLADRFEIASSGIGGWHVGEPPDDRTIAVARRHGIDVSRQRARQFAASHLIHYDHVLGMDSANLEGIQRHARAGQKAQTGLLLQEAPHLKLRDVPDPYYGGARDFEEVYRLVDAACQALLGRLAPR